MFTKVTLYGVGCYVQMFRLDKRSNLQYQLCVCFCRTAILTGGPQVC